VNAPLPATSHTSSRAHFASGAAVTYAYGVIDSKTYVAAEDMSSGVCFVYASGDNGSQITVGRCSPFDGLKMPAIGAVVNAASGSTVRLFIDAFLRSPSIQFPNGSPGTPFTVYVGSGGTPDRLALVINVSGAIIQQAGIMIPDNGQASGCMYIKPIPVGSGDINQIRLAPQSVGNTQIQSGSIAAGNNGGGIVGTAVQIQSGTIVGANIGSGAILSGHIASGQVGTIHLTSGIIVTQARAIIDDFSAAGTPLITEENISGVRAVNISQSGTLRVAMPSISGRMPVVGVTLSGALSGQACSFWTDGFFQISSGMVNFSGRVGSQIWVNRSGLIAPWSGASCAKSRRSIPRRAPMSAPWA